jgi:hypothetical protein
MRKSLLPTRRQLQFTLRGIFLVVLLLSLLLGWSNMQVQRAEADRRIVASLQGSIDYEAWYGPTSEGACEWLLRKSLGNELAGTVRILRLPMRTLTERQWEDLAQLRDLDQLWLSGFSIERAEDIDNIARLELRLLGVSGVVMSKEVLRALPRLYHLRVLFLESRHRLSAAEIRHLQSMLPHTEVTWANEQF